jgi:transposase
VLYSAPEELRQPLLGLKTKALVGGVRGAASGSLDQPNGRHQTSLRSLARRWQQFQGELDRLDVQLQTLVTSVAPALVALPGIGIDTAGQLLVTAGDNPQRLRSEAAFAHLCGAAPIPASSGQLVRYRLNRSGDRQLNRALHTIVLVRCRFDPTTRAYLDRRRAQGKTNREIKRCLARYVARQLYRRLEGEPSP